MPVLARLALVALVVTAMFLTLKWLIPAALSRTEQAIGPAGSYPVGVDARWAPDHNFFVVRNARGLYAIVDYCRYQAQVTRPMWETERVPENLAPQPRIDRLTWEADRRLFRCGDQKLFYDIEGNQVYHPGDYPWYTRTLLRAEVRRSGEAVIVDIGRTKNPEPTLYRSFQGSPQAPVVVSRVEERLREVSPFFLPIP